MVALTDHQGADRGNFLVALEEETTGEGPIPVAFTAPRLTADQEDLKCRMELVADQDQGQEVEALLGQGQDQAGGRHTFAAVRQDLAEGQNGMIPAAMGLDSVVDLELEACRHMVEGKEEWGGMPAVAPAKAEAGLMDPREVGVGASGLGDGMETRGG
mmetsp:Transcript_34361/g.102873  ORF Transcript_34361/g.102873 Transcript_34361/m.102873 type:complete len:158 (+) Transcript_34361:547-1020(+)